MMQVIQATVTQGHKVASGQATDSPYPQGSIEMQTPFFHKHGINLDDYYKATLNLSIAPYTFTIIAPQFIAKEVKWVDGFPAEDFSFSKAEITYAGKTYSGLIYYPHPETKLGHFHDNSVIEFITYYIPDIGYGDKVELKLNDASISIE